MKSFKIGDQVIFTKKCFRKDFCLDYEEIYGIVTDVIPETEERLIKFSEEELKIYAPQLGERRTVLTGRIYYEVKPFGKIHEKYERLLRQHEFHSSDLDLILRPEYKTITK